MKDSAFREILGVIACGAFAITRSKGPVTEQCHTTGRPVVWGQGRDCLGRVIESALRGYAGKRSFVSGGLLFRISPSSDTFK